MSGRLIAVTLLAAIAFGCGGVSTSPPPTRATAPPTPATSPPLANPQAVAITGTEVVGDLAEETELTSDSDDMVPPHGQNGAPPNDDDDPAADTCSNHRERIYPYRENLPNSVEIKRFINADCTGQLLRDVVRTWDPKGTTEIENRTTKIYRAGSSSPFAIITSIETISNAKFGPFGKPYLKDGLSESVENFVDIVGQGQFWIARELVVPPPDALGSRVTSLCADSAGLNFLGFSLPRNAVLGWQGGMLSGAQLSYGPGEVTWTARGRGLTVTGSHLALARRNQSTVCPITTQQWSITRGTSLGAYDIPFQATYTRGHLSNLVVANGSLAAGRAALNVQSTQAPMTSPQFIQGTFTSDGLQFAALNVNQFGDGTLTLTTGTKYQIIEWKVIQQSS